MIEKELQARLLADAEKVIKDMLAETPAVKEMSLTDIERLALWTGQQVQAKVLQELGQASQEAHSAEGAVCERCGSRMQRRGMRARQVVTEGGDMTLERAYYVCPGCGASLFPPG